jgi:hypothetical protein
MAERTTIIALHITTEDTNLFAVTIARYKEPMRNWIGRRNLGTGRWAIDFRRFSIIIECWWIR